MLSLLVCVNMMYAVADRCSQRWERCEYVDVDVCVCVCVCMCVGAGGVGGALLISVHERSWAPTSIQCTPHWRSCALISIHEQSVQYS